MKKLLVQLIISIIIIVGLFFHHGSAKTTCKKVMFDNNITTCINIKKIGTNRWNLITDIEGGSKTHLICDLMTPDSNLTSISECNGSFVYQGNKPGKIKIRIRYTTTPPIDREDKPNTTNERIYPQRTYDFKKEAWIDDYTLIFPNGYTIITSPSFPNENERIDVTIKANSSFYRGTIIFAVERKSGSGRITAPSSLYSLSQDTYTFTIADKGTKTFTNLIKFKDKNHTYRLVVYDNNNTRIKSYKIFSLYDANTEENNMYSNNFLIITNTTTPKTNQRIDLTIQARQGKVINTNYRGTINFDIYYRPLHISSRTKTTSPTYFETRNNYVNNGYTFTASNNGQQTFTNIIKFKKNNHEYKIVVYDQNNTNNQGYKIFTVKNNDTNDSNVNGFSNSQLHTVQILYNTRNDMIDKLKITYPKLKINAKRNNISNNLYQEMKKIINNDENRKYENFNKFYNAFLDRYNYTISVR